MKRINFFIKKKLFLANLLLLISLFGCKKTDTFLSSDLAKQKTVLSAKESNMKPNQIIDWLEEQKQQNTPIKNETISELINALDFSKMYGEEYYDENVFIIVPLGDKFESNNNTENNPINVLLLTENKDGNIEYGNIVQFVPHGNYSSIFPENAFSDIFNGRIPNEKGIYSFLSVDDIFQYEYEFNGPNEKYKINVMSRVEKQYCSS